MIEELTLYWELFGNSLLAGCFVAWLLSQIGVLVVARDQVFLGAALAQASTLGIAIALAVASMTDEGSWLHSRTFSTSMAVVFSVAAAMATSRFYRRESLEAVTGWVFLAAGSLAILIVADSPHGQEEVHSLLFSSIVVAEHADVWIFAVLAIATTTFFLSKREHVLLYALDSEMAAAVGMRLSLWSTAMATLLGVAIGLAIGTSGLLFSFGCLVLPPLIAKNLLRELRPMLVLAPALAVGVTALTFVVADRLSYPPGQLTVAVFSAVQVGAWAVNRRR